MSTRPRRTRPGPGPDTDPARVALSTASTAAGAPGPLTIRERPTPVVGSLCTGAGGLDLGVLAALGGGRLAWCADPDPHIRTVLAARLPGVPNLGDITRIDWTQVEPVDVLTAGFPCQDISAAGHRAGIEKGTRSGLWTHIVAAVRHLRPALVVVENVAALRWKRGGLHRVLGDLATLGFDALWRSVRAADIGAPHRRERVFLLAWPRAARVADTTSPRRRRARAEPPGGADGGRPAGEPARRDQHGGGVVADPNGLGCEELHSPHPDRRPVAARRGPVVAHADRARRHVQRDQRNHPHGWAVAAGSGSAVADTSGDRRDEGLPGAARLQGQPHAALDGRPPAAGPPEPSGEVDWVDYEPAIRRWEQRLGRLTPHPTQPGRHGGPVLAPRFVEHLMGLPAGWISELPLPRTAQLRALGNGVVPQQATYAIGQLLTDLAALLGDAPDECLGHRREVTVA